MFTQKKGTERKKESQGDLIPSYSWDTHYQFLKKSSIPK